MSDQTVLIRRSMDEQLERKHYPEGFPALPPVPTARFWDPGFADIEMQHMWKKTWLMAGVESELPDPGSFFLFEKLRLSIIVSRGKDGEIRAFHNICSHRASALLTEPKGRVARFLCPYHAWSYRLDGTLLGVPEAQDFACLDKADNGLKAVRCETWRGLIFINMDPDADSLAAFMAPCAAPTSGFPLEDLIVQDHYFVEMDCNWKLSYHNFIEAYHVNMVHPKSLGPYLDPRSWMAALLDNGHSRIAVGRAKGSSIYKTELTVSDSIGAMFKQFGVVLTNFPNSALALDPSGFAIQSFWPAGAGKSIMEVWLVGWEAKGARPEYWSSLREVLDLILAEDVRLFARTQRSIETGVLPTIRMGYKERTLYWFEEELDRRIGIDNIPAGMRVTQVLADQVER